MICIMTLCDICKSNIHELSRCNMVKYYSSMLGTLFLDYRKDRNVENLHRRMKEVTKYWKTCLWYEVARQLHHAVGAYVSINRTIQFMNKLKVTMKTSYVESFCEYFDSIEPDIYTNSHIDNYED